MTSDDAWWPMLLMVLAGLLAIPLFLIAIFGIGHDTLMQFAVPFMILILVWIALLLFSTVAAIALAVRPKQRTRRAYAAVLSGFLVCALVFVPSIAGAQTPPTSTVAEAERALSAIKKWKGFEGTWEGEVHYVAAPKEDWYKQRVFFKVVYKPNEPKVLMRYGAFEWKELGVTYRVYQPDHLTLLIHVYGAEGVWTENNVVLLTRRTEHSADVFIQRVVNNWAGKLPPGQDAIYGDSRVGSVRRAGHE